MNQISIRCAALGTPVGLPSLTRGSRASLEAPNKLCFSFPAYQKTMTIMPFLGCVQGCSWEVWSNFLTVLLCFTAFWLSRKNLENQPQNHANVGWRELESHPISCSKRAAANTVSSNFIFWVGNSRFSVRKKVLISEGRRNRAILTCKKTSSIFTCS